MPVPPKDTGKRSASLSVRLSPELKKRLEVDASQAKAKSTGDFVHTLIQEALAAREQTAGVDATGRTVADTIAKSLAEVAQSIHQAHQAEQAATDGIAKTLAGVLEAIRDSHQASTGAFKNIEHKLIERLPDPSEARAEIERLRSDVSFVLVNVLVQTGKMDPAAAAAVVHGALNRGENNEATK